MNKSVLSLATIIHLIPHPFGVSSVGATAIYAGANGSKRYFWAAPLVPLLLANLLFGFYDLTVMAFVYAGFTLSAIAARLLLGRKRSRLRFAAAIAGGAFIFYLVSNFAVWLVGMYPPTMTGLVQCYLMGLPYLGQAMLADAAFSFLLFGLHAALERRQAAVAVA